ncbi:MAG: hypothetical protein IE931_14710, partial [Sphingobacteriales bacterium]|nr:hypothetical protein [Sphingobacteriales bacterium]
MSIKPIDMIYEFNNKAGLLANGYVDERESAFPIEEALEGFDCTKLKQQLDMDGGNAKNISRKIIDLISNSKELSDVDRLDKHLDIIVFSFGSIFKLGLTPKEALEALTIVMEANMSKLS